MRVPKSRSRGRRSVTEREWLRRHLGIISVVLLITAIATAYIPVFGNSFNLCIARLQQGNTTEALPHFYRATRLDPTDPISATNVGTDLLSRGLLEEAVAKYEAVLMDPRTASVPMLLPNIHSNLGSAYLELKKFEEARDQFELALRRNPNDHVAQSGLGRIDRQLGPLHHTNSSN